MDSLLQALTDANLDFVLYAWDRAPQGDYGVISLESSDDLICDNRHEESCLSVYVDYFTRDASSTPKDTIEGTLNDICAFRLNSVQYENDTGYIHYEWLVKLI